MLLLYGRFIWNLIITNVIIYYYEKVTAFAVVQMN